jgi:hypothetical protein
MKLTFISYLLILILLSLVMIVCSKDSTSAEPEPEVYELSATDEAGIVLDIEANQRIRITATDSVNTNPDGLVEDCDLWTDANGIPDCSYVTDSPECRGLPFMALIGEFDGEYFLVGADFDSTFAEAGELTLLINDWEFYDNAGQYMVSVLIE